MLRIEEYFEETNLNKSRSLSYNIAEHFHGMFIPNKGVGTEFLFIAQFGYWSSTIVRVFQMWHFVKKKIAMPVQFPPGHI